MIPLSEPVMLGRELEYVADSVESGWISSNGSYVTRFEQSLADYLGVGHVVACNCGTSALHVSLLLHGIGPEDEVLVPTITFIAPVNAVRYVGARPVFFDADEYCNMDVVAVERFLAQECVRTADGTRRRGSGRRVAAIVPVHVLGTPVDMDALVQIAREYDLAVIEDASEALGSLYKDRQCGGLASLGCLSFNGNKVVTSGGGGAIITNDAQLAARARYLTTQAKEDGIEYIHNSVGFNYRMNNVLAALGLAQLETLEQRLVAKRSNFALYEEALGPDRLIQEPPFSHANRWFYGYVCDDAAAKQRLLEACAAASIQVRPLWLPNHQQRPYRDMESYQVTNALRLYDRVVNLPCSVTLTSEQIDEVVGIIDKTANGAAARRP